MGVLGKDLFDWQRRRSEIFVPLTVALSQIILSRSFVHADLAHGFQLHIGEIEVIQGQRRK